MKKLLILSVLVLAVIVAAVACDSASTPADTDAPATTEAVTEAPAADTTAATQAPTADTQAVTEAPAADTEADTQAPAADTEAPAVDTNAPAVDTDAPAVDTNEPAADTNAPVEPETNAPVEPETNAPVEPETNAPVVEPETNAPVVEPETNAPVVEPETNAPVVEPETNAPVVEPETNAPVVEPETNAPVVVPETNAPAQPDPEPEKTYTVVFKNWDGTSLKSETLPAGATVTPPADPTRAADAQYTYTFAGWSPTVATTVAGNATYTATFTPTLRSYTVTLLNHDGSTLATRTVPYGGTADSHTPPARNGMTFTGYSPSLENITGDRTCVAQYINQTYNDGGSIDLRRDFRFAAWFDNIYCGSNHMTSVYSRHNANNRIALKYDGWSTDSARRIILDGWLASMLGQSELIWTFGTNPTSSSTVEGPWYLCTDGFYESSDAPVLAAATDLMRKTDYPAEADKTFAINSDNGRFRSVEINLNAYAGQTVNIIVAARGTDGRAVTILELTNLYVAP